MIHASSSETLEKVKETKYIPNIEENDAGKRLLWKNTFGKKMK